MALNNKSSLDRSDLIQWHPPERGKRNAKHVVIFSGCSCCCCCLHTLGGMIGVAVAGNYRAVPEEPVDLPNPSKRLPSSQGLFWSSFFSGGVTCILLAFLLNIEQPSRVIEMTVLLMSIFGPGWLLGACVISAFLIAVRIEPPLQKGYWGHLGKIARGIVIGSIVGVVVMWAMSGVFWR